MGRIFIYFSALIFLSACNTGPADLATGKSSEVLFVCDDDLWKSDVKQIADSLLTQFILPYVPDVATFEVQQRSENRLSSAMKKYKNIVVLKIDKNVANGEATILQRKDVWATGQVVFEITAKDKGQLLSTLNGSLPEIHDVLEKAMITSLIDRNVKEKNAPINAVLAKKFGINLGLPAKSKIVTNQDNFLRIEFPEGVKPMDLSADKKTGTEPGKIFSGVMVFQYDYKDDSQMELLQLCTDRDSILRKFAISSVEGMYMTTQYGRLTYPVGTSIISDYGKVDGFEMRGMYKFTGMGMTGIGGPFWDFYFINEKTKKIVCVSTYLDISPVTSWTEHIRGIEAVWRSTKMVN